MDDIRLKAIKFISNPEGEAKGFELEVPNVLLLVGPNNSGKSAALNEINQWCLGGNIESLIIEKILFQCPTGKENALRKFSNMIAPGAQKHEIRAWAIGPAGQIHTNGVVQSQLSGINSALLSESQQCRKDYLSWFTLKIDTESAVRAVNDKKSQPLTMETPYENQMHLMQRDKVVREKILDFVHKCLGLWLSVSLVRLPELSFYTSAYKPSDSIQTGIDQNAVDYYNQRAKHINYCGLGYKAFIGFVSVILASKSQIVLVDEPETYLHPPLIRMLAKLFCEEATSRRGTFVVATHSADMVAACVENSSSVSIVRLTYDGTTGTTRALTKEELKPFTQDPLIRSSKAIEGLFHKSVVVTESDADRVIYSEINRRLLEEKRGIADALFVQVNGWITVFRVIGPLRKIGIPAAGIVDIDIFYGEGSWDDLGYFEQLGIQQSDRRQLKLMLDSCREYFKCCREHARKDKKPIPYKTKGVEAFEGDEKKKISELITKLAGHGLFVVEGGALESWLKNRVAFDGKSKSNWFKDVMTEFGDDSDSGNYLKPEADDVWKFIDRIGIWCTKAEKGRYQI